jgi:hypothetical protein
VLVPWKVEPMRVLVIHQDRTLVVVEFSGHHSREGKADKSLGEDRWQAQRSVAVRSVLAKRHHRLGETNGTDEEADPQLQRHTRSR